jgi:hypothetical protein
MKTGALILLAASILASGPALRAETEYRAAIRSTEKACAAFEAETARVSVEIENRGIVSWETRGGRACFLSWHILDARGKAFRFENPRVPLPGTIVPGGKARLIAEITAPIEAGDYSIEFDLVAEGLAWFKDRGSATLIMPLKVTERGWGDGDRGPGLDDGPYSRTASNVPEFDVLIKLIRATLKRNEIAFEGKTGRVEGFFAGTGYPEIWLRDAATIIPASKYFYPESRLRSWLDEHLALQRPDGSLWDWLDSRGRTDKNTVETDQEASAVLAARRVSRLIGTKWMKEPIAGIAAIDRLQNALDSVLRDRFDAASGLVTGAHTADWGDVESEDADQSAVYFGPTSHRTADIYDQAMFFGAAMDLAALLDDLGRKREAEAWRSRAELLRNATDKRLWMPERGYYRVHVHLDPYPHDFAEDDIFAMGGNVRAILSGLAAGPAEGKAARIFANVMERKKRFGVSTLSGTLYPPYPRGFFRHPILDDPYEYQNGGQWDWFGGDLILAMFEGGFAGGAKAGLVEIVRKDIANGGLYEWDALDGAGRGSAFFSGSAGSLAAALVEGYYGIRIAAPVVELSPRLGLDKARVHVHIPAAGRYCAYDYGVLEDGSAVRWEIRTDFVLPVTLRILNPWGPGSGGRRAEGRKTPVEVLRNGIRIACSLERTGNDEYILFDSGGEGAVFDIRYLPPKE